MQDNCGATSKPCSGIDAVLYLNQHMTTPQAFSGNSGEAVIFTRPADDNPVNEDSAAVFEVSDSTWVLAVADGMGGGPRGQDASRIAINAIADQLENADPSDGLRQQILDAFESAQRAITDNAPGAATTLVVSEISAGLVRTYHAGDSGALLTGRGGKLKLKTIFHSPSGYAEESGLLTENQALMHEERHYVSNLVGSEHMSVEFTTPYPMAKFDTLVLGSDGLFDNLTVAEISDAVRTGKLSDAAVRLLGRVGRRMRSDSQNVPSKPDDLAFILFRQT